MNSGPINKNEIQDIVSTGTFAAKQINSPVKIFSISHRLRFKFALNLIEKYAPKCLLDYGCGDGTFLAMLGPEIEQKFGIDMDRNHLKNVVERFKNLKNYTFFHVDDVKKLNQKFDVVTCMEVMEHCPPDYLQTTIENLKKLVSPKGRLIISVPIEIGPVLAIKQFFRRLAGIRGIKHYQYTEGHSFIEFLKFLFATENTAIDRHYYYLGNGENRYLTCGHRGFNWKFLRKKLSHDFIIEKTNFSPFKIGGSLCNSQAWFILKLK